MGQTHLAGCVHLWQRLPNDYAWQASVSDFWDAYALVLDARRHCSVGKAIGAMARLTRKTLAFSTS